MNSVHREKGGKNAKNSFENRRAIAGLPRRRSRVVACRNPRRRADRTSPIPGRWPLQCVCMPYLAIAHQIAGRPPTRSQGIDHHGTSQSALGQLQALQASQGTDTSVGSARASEQRARFPGLRFALHRRPAWRAVQEDAGLVELGVGWCVTLPEAYRQQNSNGSWSAWGIDWSMDIDIMQRCDAVQEDFSWGSDAVEPTGRSMASGDGWIGSKTLLIESDGRRTVHGLTARLVASDSIASVAVCCLGRRRAEIAEELLHAVAHRPPVGLLRRLFARKPSRL